MAQVTRKLPWHRRLSLRWALVFTTLLCALAGFLLLALETAVLEEARDAIYYKYITPYYAEESATGDLYAISPDGKTVYVEATMPYAYVDPDTGETYPLADTPSSQFVPAGPLRFFYQHVGEIALGVYVATAVLCFLADAWWFYHWKIKKPLAVLGAASKKIAENDLGFAVEQPSGDELGQLCASFETMRRSLEENNKALWQAVEERRRLNAAFAHDLRTPLTVLQGYGDYLLEGLPAGQVTPEKAEETLTTMKRSLTRLQRYAESMSELQRLEDLVPQKAPVDFGALCRLLEDTAAILRGPEGVGFTAQGTGTVYVDQELVFRVFENLMSNAGRYAKQRVEITVCLEGGQLCFTVADDGHGFPREALKRAAEPYYRAEGPSGSHFGLGLTICQLLCKKHGGSLTLGNRPQGGAEVTAAFGVEP